MSKKIKSLEEHFETLRNADPISFSHSRRMVEASSMLHDYGGVLPALRLDAALLLKRCFDFLLLPVVSAGLSVVLLIGSGSKMGAEKLTSKNFQPIMESTQTFENAASYTIHPSDIKHKISSKQDKAFFEGTTLPNSEFSYSSEIEIIHPATPTLDLLSSNNNHFSYASIASYPSEKFFHGITFGIRTIGFQKFGAGVSPTTNSLFANIALNASYALDMHQSLGIEIGQECFGREAIVPHEVLIGDPRTGAWTKSTIEQPTQTGNLLPWFGAFYQYSLPELSIANIYPFAQIFAGATSGLLPLGKGMIGFEFNPDNSFLFRVAAEASYLNYPFQGARQSSWKEAITAGISIKW